MRVQIPILKVNVRCRYRLWGHGGSEHVGHVVGELGGGVCEGWAAGGDEAAEGNGEKLWPVPEEEEALAPAGGQQGEELPRFPRNLRPPRHPQRLRADPRVAAGGAPGCVWERPEGGAEDREEVVGEEEDRLSVVRDQLQLLVSLHGGRAVAVQLEA
eukprot:3941347-Rhodomonas_salina.1